MMGCSVCACTGKRLARHATVVVLPHVTKTAFCRNSTELVKSRCPPFWIGPSYFGPLDFVPTSFLPPQSTTALRCFIHTAPLDTPPQFDIDTIKDSAVSASSFVLDRSCDEAVFGAVLCQFSLCFSSFHEVKQKVVDDRASWHSSPISSNTYKGQMFYFLIILIFLSIILLFCCHPYYCKNGHESTSASPLRHVSACTAAKYSPAHAASVHLTHIAPIIVLTAFHKCPIIDS